MAEIKTKHGLPETKGTFKTVGLVSGVKKEDFFTNKEQRDGNERNTVKFGVKTSKDNEVFVQISDSEKELAYFFRNKDDEKGWTRDTKKIPWSERELFNENGYRLIGTTIGIEKHEVEGKIKNKTVVKTGFDSAKYIDELSTKDIFKDNMPVRAMGNIEYSSFDAQDGGKIRFKRFSINKLYNSNVDFEAEDFVEECDFKQQFVYIGTEFKKDDENQQYALVTGKVITYSTIEDVEFVIRNKKLATNFKKRLKPYTSIVVFGNILNKAVIEEVVSDDDWGSESDPFERAKTSRKMEMEIVGIKTDDIDKDTFTEEKINEAMKAEEDFGDDFEESSDNDWGEDDGKWD